jgi:preprotein translocase subunit SecG
MDLLLLKIPFIMHIVSVVWILCAVILILVILIQKGRGTGLSGALGGGMASGILGTKTGDFLTWVTVGLVSALLLLTVAMAKFYRPTAGRVTEAPAGQTQPVTTPPAQPGAPQGQTNTSLPDQGQSMPDMTTGEIGTEPNQD